MITEFESDNTTCWLWDIVDSIEEGRTYPYCDGLLHWLKRTGYARYHRRSRAVRGLRRICRVDRYPRYVKALSRRLVSSARRIAGLNRKD